MFTGLKKTGTGAGNSNGVRKRDRYQEVTKRVQFMFGSVFVVVYN